MDKDKAYRALLEVARIDRISVQTVIEEIDLAIAEAINSIQKTNNATAMEKWKMIPCEGEVPTALELMAYLGDVVKKIS